MRSLGQVVRSPITLLANWVPYVNMIVAWHVRPVLRKVGPMRPMVKTWNLNMGHDHPVVLTLYTWTPDGFLTIPCDNETCFYHGTCDSFNEDDEDKPLDFRVDSRVTRFLIWEQPPNHWPNHPITPSLFLKWQFQYQILIKWQFLKLIKWQFCMRVQPLQNLI